MNFRTALVVGLAAGLLSFPAEARDWFVRAGADGDGSQARPFADPWQALDQCQSGDVIHVAAGSYTGRLGNGMWEVPVDDVTLLGGYDADFKTRDPWKNLTKLHWDKASKNRPKQERFLSNKKNTVLDGVVIDQRDQCPYETDAQLGRKEAPSCDSAIRLMADPADVELTNNTFNHNLWSNVMRPQDNTTVDDKTFASLKDFKFKKLSGNQVISAGLPVDQTFFDAYLSRTAYVPGKVTMDEWNQLRELIGQPVLATGGKGPEGFAPNFPWQKALQLFPKNPKVTAGARAKDLPLVFAGK